MKKKCFKKINIVKITGIFLWNSIIYNDACMICHCGINEFLFRHQNKILSNKKKFDTNETFLAGQGKCGHVFHLNCIEKWLARTRICPLCRKSWFYHEILKLV